MKKRIILTFCMVALSLLAVAQKADFKTFSSAEEAYFFMAYDLLKKGYYAQAVEAGEKALTVLQESENNTDSLQAETHFIIGAGYGQQNQTDKAVAEFNKAIEVYSRSSSDQRLVANMNAHSAHYLNMVDRVTEAAAYAQKAVDYYLTALPNDNNMCQAMVMTAEIAYKQKKYQDAIDYQKIALRLHEKNHGKHSEGYIGECDYMATYYSAIGNDAEANQICEEAKRLREEMENGYVPQPVHFNSPEQCHLYNEDAFYAAKYYLTHQMDADSMAFVAKYLLDFAASSNDVTIIGGYPELKWQEDCGKTGPWLEAAYSAGFMCYQLQNPEEMPSEKAYAYGNVMLCLFYRSNRAWLDESKTLEKYVKSMNSNEKKFLKQLSKQYVETMKLMESAIKKSKGF